jgi:SAM-dependent methyltransferase
MQDKWALERQDRLAAEPCIIDEVAPIEDGRLRVSGWAFPDPGSGEADPATRFSANGVPPLSVEYPTPRPGVQEVFWQRPNAEMSGFTAIVPEDYTNGVIEFRCVNSLSTAHDRGREIAYFPDPKLHENLPDADRRYRVIGNRDARSFLLTGATDAFRIKAAYENVTGKRWSEVRAALDWGCGCGRLARHLAPELGGRLFGCDIDADNAAWCAANLPGSYKPSKLSPPLPYDDESFDVIYCLSVFTHLRANWEKAWLKELRRVLKPEGVLLASVHGQTAIDFAALQPSVYKDLTDRVANEGLVVTGDNSQLDGFVENPSEYVNVFHSKQHIADVWGRFFTDIEVLPGYVFTHDLVVATKRGRSFRGSLAKFGAKIASLTTSGR